MSSSDSITLVCPTCSNQFSIPSEYLGKKVQCPICESVITAQLPESQKKEASPHARSIAAESTANPKKRFDVRTLPKRKNQTEGEENQNTQDTPQTTKIRKQRENSDIPLYVPKTNKTELSHDAVELLYNTRPVVEKNSHWVSWLIAIGIILSLLSVFIFTSAQELANQDIKVICISDRFIDREAESISEVEKDLIAELERRAKQYNLSELTRRQADREVFYISQKINTALNQLGLFLMASTDHERLKYIIPVNQIEEKLKHWSSRNKYPNHLPLETGKTHLTGNLLQVKLLMDDNKNRTAVFLFDEVQQKWLLDWEAWVGYSDMDATELLNNKPTSPTPVRVLLGINDVYKAPFFEEASEKSYKKSAYLSYSLTFPDGKELNAYVDRYQPMALDLLKKLSGGSIHAVLRISFPEGYPDCNSVIINDIIRTGWMCDKTYPLFQKVSSN